MDRIKVSDAALRNSAATLQQLDEQANGVSSTCIHQLSAQLSELETNFRKDIEKYIEEVRALNTKLRLCVDENVSALADRLVKLAEYETHTYSRRNIG